MKITDFIIYQVVTAVIARQMKMKPESERRESKSI